MRHRPAVVAGLCATALSTWYLLTPATGEDLAAQVARTDFARHHPLTPVDLRWFGGTMTFGYSLWTPLVMVLLGVRLTGALCCVAATVQTTVLFARTGARRPAVGGTLAAVSQVLNLVVGRVTFSLGLVCGLGALLAVTSTSRVLRTTPLQRAGVLSLLAGAASPVAALFLWVCAAALFLTGRRAAGLVLLIASAVPVAVVSGVFGDGGAESFNRQDARDALLASLVVLLVVPLRYRAVKVGAAVGIVMVLVAYFADTAVGNNAARLSMLFAVPITAAYVTWRPVLAALAVAAAAWPQQLAVRYDFTPQASARAAYYAPLIARIQALGPVVGRVEVPETSGHWEDAYVARALPLARGWVRQIDIARNGPVFFRGQPSAQRYAGWLRDNAVQYVAVPDTKLAASGKVEARTLATPLPFLRLVWRGAHWTLYAVHPVTPIVTAPGTVVAMRENAITLAAPPNATVRLRLRWFRWLSLETPDSGACIEPGDGGVRLRTGSGGTYRLSSSLAPSAHC